MLYAAAGVAALLAALLPRLLSGAPTSMPMVFLGAGILGFALMDDLPAPDPIAHQAVAEHITELTVIVSLMGAGLALDRPFGRRRWSTTWRLLGLTMPMTVIAVAVLGSWFLGLGAAAAILLAAALAPTDPVLANEVQVGEPTEEEGKEDETRFGLTSEAGLNDGLAFRSPTSRSPSPPRVSRPRPSDHGSRSTCSGASWPARPWDSVSAPGSPRSSSGRGRHGYGSPRMARASWHWRRHSAPTGWPR